MAETAGDWTCGRRPINDNAELRFLNMLSWSRVLLNTLFLSFGCEKQGGGDGETTNSKQIFYSSHNIYLLSSTNKMKY